MLPGVIDILGGRLPEYWWILGEMILGACGLIRLL